MLEKDNDKISRREGKKSQYEEEGGDSCLTIKMPKSVANFPRLRFTWVYLWGKTFAIDWKD